ncbi:trichohyalin-like, partial [Lingula anatina]|uniref:Trichohyalin-like n=1 Tax=Lingula anatina TaxID=7574 RepID=A0A1S3IJ07_LINAN
MASGFQGQGQGQKPLSRLQQLQIDYQAKLMREKEQKLAKMYEENQKRAMERVAQNSGRGMVRDFFNERRNIASQQSVVPNIHQHYKAKKKYEYGGPSGFQPSKPPVPPGHQPQQKNSAGRDRAHPLAPIERTKTYESGSLSDGAVINSPKPPKKQSARQSSNLKNKENSGNNLHYGSEGNINSPESNAEKQNILSGSSKARVAKYKQRKAQVFKHDIESSDEEPVRNQSKPKAKPKITDFQKWQMEQDAARERRLAAHQQQHAQNDVYDGTFDRDDGEEGGDSNDEDREEAAREEEEQEERRQEQLKKQQEEKELLRLLAKRQEELKQLQQERLRAEEEEKKQAKKEAAEKERKRRLQQAADEQRKREEEQRVWQEEQKDKEEEEEGGESYGASTSNVSHFNGHSGPVHEKPITPKDVFPKKPSRVKPHPPSRPPAQRTRHQPTPEPEPEPEMDRQRSPPAAFYEDAAASAVTADD